MCSASRFKTRPSWSAPLAWETARLGFPIALQSTLATGSWTVVTSLLARMGAADHFGHDLLLRGFADRQGADATAIAQDGDAVGNLEDLGHMVADIDDADALVRQVPEHRKKALNLIRCQG